MAEVIWHQKKVEGLTKAQVIRGIAKATLAIEREAKISISKSAGRSTGPRGGTVWLTPSKPGDPPHIRTGLLKSSIGHDFQEGGLVGRVGTDLKYGKFLELGTVNMEARPYLRPAFDRITRRVERFFRGNL